MPLEAMESKGAYWLRMRGTTENYPLYKKVLGDLEFTFVENHNCYKIDRSKYPSLSHMTQHVESLVRVELKKKAIKGDDNAPLPDLEVELPLKVSLFRFQRQGVRWLMDHPHALLCDQQGLGKTLQTISACIGLGCERILVITAKHLCSVWAKEIEKATNFTTLVFRDSIRTSWPMYLRTGQANVGIVNYDSMEKFFVKSVRVPDGEPFRSSHIELFEAMELWDAVIVDEFHNVKDPASRRTKIAVRICRPKPVVFLLSGTPVLNKVRELYAPLCMIGMETKFAASREDFNRRYDGKNSGNRIILQKQLKRLCFLRRLKSDVLPDLPEKMRQQIYVDIDNREEYDLAETQVARFIQESLVQSRGEIDHSLRRRAFGQMQTLRRIAAKGKISMVLEWANSLINDGQKVVLYGHHKAITKGLKASIPGSVSVVGEDNQLTRDKNLQCFLEDKECPAIVCSISAAAEGLTLTVSSNLGIVELPWHFGKMEQIEDRIHRIGQKDGAVITAFLGKDTIDEHMFNIVMTKKQIHDDVTGTEESVSTEVMDSLIHYFSKKKSNTGEQHSHIGTSTKTDATIERKPAPRLNLDDN